MTRWVALLRGVNVGGHQKVPMADLRRALAGLGADDVATYLQSGNVVLTLPGADAGRVGSIVRDAVASLGVTCGVVVRTSGEMVDVVRRNPWPDRAEEHTRLNVGFLSEPVPSGQARRAGPDEEVRFDGREVWIWYGAGAGRSKLTLDVGDAVLTVRNWRTVRALADLGAT